MCNRLHRQIICIFTIFPAWAPMEGMLHVHMHGAMVLDGLPSCGAKGLGGADPRWSYPAGRGQCGVTPSSKLRLRGAHADGC